jgi:hypothetical protein
MKFWVFDQPMMVGEWAFADVLKPRYGDAPRCPSCDTFIDMKPWLPPYRMRLLKGTKTLKPADVVTGPGMGGFVASERFVAEFERAGLKGIERWEPVEITNYQEQRFKFAILPVRSVRAKLKEMHAYFKDDKPPDCPVCGTADLDSYDGVVVDEASWIGDDIFELTNLGGPLIVTDRFAEFIASGKFTGVPLVATETFVPSWVLNERQSRAGYSDFRRYRAPYFVNDGTVVDWVRDGDRLTVRIKDWQGKLVAAGFWGVVEVKANKAEGMRLHALAEMQSKGPGRRYLFVPWDEKDERSLEVIAESQEEVKP